MTAEPLPISDIPPAGIRLTSADETRTIGYRIGLGLMPESILALSGDLGAGKTTFVQGLALALGVTRTVTSPTFNILLSYPGTRATLHHLDAYRLQDSTDPDAICPPELLVPPFCLCIEWPERAGDLVPPDAPWLRIEVLPGQSIRRLIGISDVFASSRPPISP